MRYQISITDPTTGGIMGAEDWDFPFLYSSTAGSILASHSIPFDDASQVEHALGRTICSMYGMEGSDLIALLRSCVSAAGTHVLLELLQAIILFPDGIVRVDVVAD